MNSQRKVEVFFGDHLAWSGHVPGLQDDQAMLAQFRDGPRPANYFARDLAVGDLVRLDQRATYRMAVSGFEFVKRSEDRQLITDPAAYLKTIFKESDRLAVLLIDQREGVKQATQQRIATAREIVTPGFQRWLGEQNQHGYNVYVGMNALKPGATGRTKEDIGAIRTLYVDIDAGGRDKVRAILNAAETPRPDWVLNTSPGKYQAIWKVAGIEPIRAEETLRAMAQHFGTDMAATDMSRVLRLPGFANQKYGEPYLVRGWQVGDQVHAGQDFKIKYDAARRTAIQRAPGIRTGDPGENTQSHADVKFAHRQIRKAIKAGVAPDVKRIGRRIDTFREELYAQGRGKQKLPSRGETYGERTARRAYEFFQLHRETEEVIKDYIAKHRLSPGDMLTFTFSNAGDEAVECAAEAGRALTQEFQRTVSAMKAEGLTLAKIEHIGTEQRPRFAKEVRQESMSQGIGVSSA